MKKILLMLTMFVLTTVSVVAQQIKGVIKDKLDGTPLVGASVVAKGTTTGSVTDANGAFEFTLPNGATTLVVSFVGYVNKEVAINGQQVIDIIMESDANVLSDVVVVGYSSQSKREVSGSISKVKAEDIENLPVQSFDRALQGRAAGVQVTSSSGAPGSAVSIRIRGVGSITAGNEPLYVVDGVQISSTSANNVNNNATVSNNPLGFINPNDIESIEIIKDAASAAIYGSAAANGVIIVTTKKGKQGKTKFNFNVYRGSTEQFKRFNSLNSQEYIQVRGEARLNALRAAGSDISIDSAKRLVLGEIRFPVTTPVDSFPTYDWQKAATRAGQIQNYELSASGGNEKTQFTFSGSYNQQDANIINIDFERGAASLGLTNKVSDWLSFDTKLNLSTSTQRGLFGGSGGGSFLGSPAFSAPIILPMNRIYNDDGSFFGAAPLNLTGILNQNVVQVGSLNKIKSRIDQFVGTFRPIIKINNDLTLVSSVSLDFRNTKSSNYQDPTTADAFAVNGRLTEERGQNSNFLANSVLNYSHTFGNSHNLGLLAGTEFREEAYEEIFTSGTGVASPTFSTLSATAVDENVTGFGTGFKRAGVFGSVKYSFNEKYNITTNLRYDGSSRFGANNKYGLFWGVAASWNIMQEDFMKGLTFIDILKLRGSYGQTGNDQIGNFQSRGLFGVGGTLGFTNGVYNGLPGTQFSNIASPDLTWERNTTQEVGLEIGLFKDAIFVDVDYFNKVSSDLLLDQQLPFTNGIGTVTRNLGRMTNRGWELSLTLKPLKIRDFEWKTNFNIAIIENKVTKLYDGIVKQPTPDSLTLIGAADVNGVGVTATEGYPLGSIFAARYAGVNPSTGRPMWYDAFGNLTYLLQTPRDNKIVGDGFAEYVGGVNSSISYGNINTFGRLSLEVFFQGEFGRQAIDGARQFASENGGRTFNSVKEIYDNRWLTPGQITDVPRPYNGNAELRGTGQTAGDRFVNDASYVRLKTLSLSYSFPKSLLDKIKLSDLRIYAQGFNLVTWTKWKGLDPEFVNVAGNGTNGQLPQTRNFLFGLQFGF
jgi:TonB-dependent starch-binding outer membrane protein SusC